MADRPLVLIANDQEWSARSLESILAPNGFGVVRAYTGAQTLETVPNVRPDLIILDAQMPDMHGFEVCRILRDDARLGAQTTPVIITTAGPSGRAQRIEAYQAGAWEFFGQPLDGEALLLKLTTYARAKLEADELRDENLLDPPTGLYSMKGLARRAREIGADASRRRDPLACVVFAPDLDALAPDETAAGDAPRQTAEWIGRAVRQAARASDAVGRLGPAEYGVVAPATDTVGAGRLAARLSGAVEGTPVPLPAGDRWVRMRAGYCAVPDFAESAVDVLELLLRATTALRELQKEGDSERVRSFEPPSLNLPAGTSPRAPSGPA
ncbi:MAG TPA: response regulator [Gemmatimonadales bacterium]|nr:response regulator [Gemmatimonadales bacterium]